ncbi:MAG TPA: tannase/feruloyl esterase family alpha/beta hydrolase [Terracidiphilus sp.]
MRKLRAGVVASAILLAAGAASAQDCAGLKNLRLDSTEITAADTVTSGTLDLPEAVSLHDLPAFCRVQGIMRPGSDSKIRFEVWLPAKNWNGRELGVGNGGFAGVIGYQQMGGYLLRGFTVSGTDTGHQANGTDATWAFQHPEKVKDFGWRSIHLTAQRSKEILRAYYGKPQQKSYFDACSDGGREALMEAQRFPDDYDGILAGAPAYAWSTLLASGVSAMQALGDPTAYISSFKLPAIQKASLDACDSLDGAKDGIIGDPSQCRFDPQVLLCKGEESLDCLTQPQIKTLQTLYNGARSKTGQPHGFGFSMGDELGWAHWIVGEDPEASAFSQFVRNDFRYIVTGDPKWNGLTADPDAMMTLSHDKSAEDLDSTDPDLSKFSARGGKLILYHGWNDPAIAPGYTIDYYKQVRQKMGADKTGSFVRLYMVPGMEHCIGGPGATAFGQFGVPTEKGSRFGLFDSLENWVEKGAPDDNVIATRFAPQGNAAHQPSLTRPLCAYPTVPKYKGSGDINDAASFACAQP